VLYYLYWPILFVSKINLLAIELEQQKDVELTSECLA
jgi:hypothetical protein